MTTTADKLAALPENVQEQLLRIARVTAGMSQEEKGYTAMALTNAALHFALNPDPAIDPFLPGAECLTAVARITRMTHDHAVAQAAAKEGV